MEASISATIDTGNIDSDVIVPSEESLERSQRQQVAFDNKDYQRENHDEACKILNIPSPKFPRMRSMNRSAKLKHWQPVGIAAIIAIREKEYLNGAVLGDSVGLGKTWQAIGVMLKIWEDYNASVMKAKEESTEIPKAKPFLVVMPPGLILQWVSEMHKMTHALEAIVYHSDLPGTRNLGRRLTREYELFNGDPNNGKIVIITSYQTMNMRHGPGAVKLWRSNNGMSCPLNVITPPAGFPWGLRGCFDDIIIDEAHALRNEDSAQSRTIQWLRGKFHLLITATLIYNRKEDFCGYMPLLFRSPSLWKKAKWESLEVAPDENIFHLPKDHPAKHLCCSKDVVKKYILNKKVLPQCAGDRLRGVLEQLYLRRSLQSRVPFDAPRTIGSDIPPLQRRTIMADYNDFERHMYDHHEPIHKRGLVMRSDRDPKQYIWNMKKLRMLVLLTAWLGFHISKRSYMPTRSHTSARGLPMELSEPYSRKQSRAEEGGGAEANDIAYFFENAAEMTGRRRTWTLEFLLRGSPKMREMLKILRDQVIVYGEKAIVWTHFPAEQVFIAATLIDANIDGEVFHSGLSVAERGALIEKFTTQRDKCMVLGCNYSVGSAGLSLQGLCRNVHLFSPGLSNSALKQAIGRVWRLNQERVVLVYDYRLRNTFNMEMIEKNKLKSIPGLVAELGKDVYIADARKTDDEVDIGRLVIRDGELHQLGDGEDAEEGDITDQVKILKAFLNMFD